MVNTNKKMYTFDSGACATYECNQTGCFECEDCESLYCQNCIIGQLRGSSTYGVFYRSVVPYICIYCFIDIQYRRIQRLQDGRDPRVYCATADDTTDTETPQR